MTSLLHTPEGQSIAAFPTLPRTVRRVAAWTLLAICLLGLVAVCAAALTIGKTRVERTVVARVEQRLDDAGVADLAVNASGRDVTITGPQARKSEAFVGDTPGVRTVAAASTADPVAHEPTSTDSPSVELEVVTGADTILLQGTVPDAETKAEISRAAASAFATVDDRLEVGSDDANWAPGLLLALPELSKVTNGTMRLEGDVLTLEGAVVDVEVRRQISTTFATAAPGMELKNQIRIDAEAVSTQPLDSDQEALLETLVGPQRQIDTLLARANTGRPMFAVDSPRLSPAGVSAVSEIAEVLTAALADAPDARAAIGGHTDSTGSAQRNQSLSEQRAASVLRRLVSEGVSRRRLTAAGFGADKPVADNTTAAGRAENRRITIDLALPDPD